ncbi:MAG TPA: winged helix DNA-binding domain-containing protein, partial [Streptosporangiaceae bacterium]|nr:winged helix DNA-binding domain-containing protein [Streptosporangiaceae bacterium]
GMQAQAPLAPYVGLWTRLAGFVHQDLEDLLSERSVVRAHAHRSTIHLLTAEDFVSFRPLFQPLMDRGPAGNFGRNLVGVDLAELRVTAAALLSREALTRVEIGRRLAVSWPEHDPASLAYAATHQLHLVQVPPRGLWGENGQPAWFLGAAWLAGLDASPPDPAATWLDGPSASPPDPARAREQLVLRYLAAYGPASVHDIQAWSGLSRLREVTERLRTRLRTFTGPDGGQLLDLPDAPRPSPDVPAPPRFLPEYDNLLLSYAERRRVIPHRRPVPLPPGNGATGGTLLVDGRWQADWKIVQGTLEVRPFIRLSATQTEAIAAEGKRLLDFAGPAGIGKDVRFAPVS